MVGSPHPFRPNGILPPLRSGQVSLDEALDAHDFPPLFPGRGFWNVNHSYDGGARRRGADSVTMIAFDAAHRAVHYPPDRRFRIWIRPSILIGVVVAIVALIAAAWIEVAVTGMPPVPAVPQIYPNNFAGPHGFPVWVRYCHFFNFSFCDDPDP